MEKPQILVIDDEEALVKTIERTLKKDYQVFSAFSGIQGLKTARRIKPDLIILDVMMPGIDGYETCRELRTDPILRETPVLFLSAVSNVESKITGLEAGADDYIIKPFDIRELHLRIQAILRRSAEADADKSKENGNLLKQGDITLNSQSFEVTTPEGRVHLTPIEFDILYYLMSHPNEIFSSNRLLQEIWDYPTETGSTDLVRMHIKNLRSKIEPNPSKPTYIRTIPRYGYTIRIDDGSQAT